MPDDLFGVQLFSEELTDGHVLNPIIEAHSNFVRVPLQWRFLEPVDTDPPFYGWSILDPIIRRLNEGGQTPIAVIFGKPNWAASQTCGPVDLAPLSRYADFIEALAERYDGDGIDDAPGAPLMQHFEIENEQDFDPDPVNNGDAADHGSCYGGALAGAYGDQLRAAYLAAHGANPAATVVFGGLAFERFYNLLNYSPVGPFDYTFTENALGHLHTFHGNEAEWPFFDWMGLHAYNDFRNNWDDGPYKEEFRGKLHHFRENKLLDPGIYDLRDMPIAITELGLSSAPSDAWTERSEEIQSYYPAQILARAKAEDLAMVLWFVGKDRFTGPCEDIYAWQTFGLLRSKAVFDEAALCSENPIPSYSVSSDNERKPALTAYRTAMEQLAGRSLDAELDETQTGSVEIEAYRYKNSSDAHLIVAFTDSGERLGRITPPLPVTRTMTFDASILPGWTDRIAITDHLGGVTFMNGTSIELVLEQSPVFVRPD